MKPTRALRFQRLFFVPEWVGFRFSSTGFPVLEMRHKPQNRQAPESESSITNIQAGTLMEASGVAIEASSLGVHSGFGKLLAIDLAVTFLWREGESLTTSRAEHTSLTSSGTSGFKRKE